MDLAQFLTAILTAIAQVLAAHATEIGGAIVAAASTLALVARRRSLAELKGVEAKNAEAEAKLKNAIRELEQARAMTAFVRDAMERLTALEAHVRELEAELRASHARERALLEELESLREQALVADRSAPLPPRPRRDDTGRHPAGALTRSLAHPISEE